MSSFSDSYMNSINNLCVNDSKIVPYGGVKMVKECFDFRDKKTIFPGVFYKDAVLSLMSRCNSDSVVLYNKYSFEKAHQVFSIFSVGISIASRPYLIKNNDDDIREKGLSVFFEQSIVPYGYKERLYVIKKLISFANKEKSRRLVICVRDYRNSPHAPKIAFKDIIRKQKLVVPSNLDVIVGRSDDWLPRAEHVISVTSSVLLDAINRNKYVTVLELPRSEHYGQGLFLGSGLMRKDVIFPTDNVNEAWRKLHVSSHIIDEFLIGENKEVFDFKLSIKNIKCILKANFLHFGRLNKDFIRFSIKNIVFFHKYHKIYLQNQRNETL
ncbi:DUF6716 putative glycosyltransferase [Enterovibrio norvegicus]|nr:DUF6716 putative glycosyltransferase [Enterovibrio norvegicus]